MGEGVEQIRIDGVPKTVDGLGDTLEDLSAAFIYAMDSMISV